MSVMLQELPSEEHDGTTQNIGAAETSSRPVLIPPRKSSIKYVRGHTSPSTSTSTSSNQERPALRSSASALVPRSRAASAQRPPPRTSSTVTPIYERNATGLPQRPRAASNTALFNPPPRGTSLTAAKNNDNRLPKPQSTRWTSASAPPAGDVGSIPSFPPRLSSKAITTSTEQAPETSRARAYSNGTTARRQPPLRVATSIPDYSSIQANHPLTSSSEVNASSGKYNTHSSILRKNANTLSLRESQKSQLTANSSAIEGSSTERSSVLTDQSSASEYTTPNTEAAQASEDENDEMSVEDAISMYADGFGDDLSTSEIARTDPGKPPPIPQSLPSPLPSPILVTPSIPALGPLPPLITTLPSLPFSSPPINSPTTSVSSSILNVPPIIPSPTFPASPAMHDPQTFDDEGIKPLDPPRPPFSGGVVAKPFASALDKAPSHVRSSTQILTGDLQLEALRDATTPQFQAIPRDRYGFKKITQHVREEQYNSWNTAYSEYINRRRRKWFDLMTQYNLPTDNPTRFPPKNDKVKRYIRKGIPPEWRGAAWFWYADGPRVVATNFGLYENLLRRVADGKLAQTDKDDIEKDLHRTFPDNIKFKPDGTDQRRSQNFMLDASAFDTPLIVSLRQVLHAFAVHNPKIGYCQSLNFLAGHLLLFLSGDEEKAFTMLCILTSEHLPGTHGLALEGSNIDVGVLMVSLKEFAPQLWSKIDDRIDTKMSIAAADMRVTAGLPTVSLATTAWFMGCFVSTLPAETACRVWDCLWYEGSKTLFRVALSLFRIAEEDINKARDMLEVFQIVQSKPKGLLDANLLIETATRKGRGGFGALSQKTVERRRAERRDLYRRERDRVLRTPTDSVEMSEFGSRVSGDTKLARSLSRATMKRFKSKRSLKRDSGD